MSWLCSPPSSSSSSCGFLLPRPLRGGMAPTTRPKGSTKGGVGVGWGNNRGERHGATYRQVVGEMTKMVGLAVSLNMRRRHVVSMSLILFMSMVCNGQVEKCRFKVTIDGAPP
eukprot:748566-Hanusia_phi.AAC.2